MVCGKPLEVKVYNSLTSGSIVPFFQSFFFYSGEGIDKGSRAAHGMHIAD